MAQSVRAAATCSASSRPATNAVRAEPRSFGAASWRARSTEVDFTKVDTLRRYADALGGTLRVEVQVGEESFRIA